MKILEKSVAIIIPVYKVDLVLVEKCVTSILKQTYKNYKIYIVDDGNDEIYQEKLMEISQKYSCIYVKHEKNRGLFQARITGVEQSESDYILFVDADDAISIDWLRLLVNKANENQADMVMGKTISVDENGWNYIRNRHESVYSSPIINGKDIIKRLMEDEGADFSIHTVWNKLYTRNLWKKALAFLKKCDKHLIMTEDILFSVILFYYANKLVFSNHDGYFYYRNTNSSTLNTNGLEKTKKNIEDLIYVFSKVRLFLEEKRIWDIYKNNYIEWKNRYFRWWSYIINSNTKADTDDAKEIKKEFLTFFEKECFEDAKLLDSFFDNARTTWNPRLEEIKGIMSSEEIKVVSFDLFDTLIKRPVLYPEDVLEIISYELPIDNPEKQRFIKIRQAAERYARRIKSAETPGCEDITIEDIYSAMNTKFGVCQDICNELKEREISLEIEFAQCRRIGKELFELAKILGKRVVITSDMYLQYNDILRILEKNKYVGIDKIYLSSDIKLLKSTGNLFEYVIKDNGDVFANEIMHIGDNWQSDYIIPSGKGIKGFFLPKTKDILFNSLGDAYTGNSLGDAVENSNSIIDLSKHFSNLAIRSMYAVIANELFDNPFYSFNEYSNYNGDAHMIGFMPMGMHMFGIANWIIKKSIEKGYSKVHFTARDGYYIMEIYEILRKRYYKDAPESNYINLSRKALIPIEVNSKEKVLNIIDNISYASHSPISIIETYHAVLKPLTKEMETLYAQKGIVLSKKFSSVDECIVFLQTMADIQFDDKKAKQQFAYCQNYFHENITENDVVFDLGYSGKLHKLVIEALGFTVDGLYLHNNGYESLMRMKNYNFKIESYYEFVPSMSGVINEYFFSDYGPSCIGYENKENGIQPIFEVTSVNGIEKYVLAEMHRGSRDFTNSLLDNLITHFELIQTHSIDTAVLYEKLLMHMKDYDKALFENCYIEDEYYGGVKKSTISEIWNWQVWDRKVEIKEIVKYEKDTNSEIEVMERIQYEKNGKANIAYELFLSKIQHKSLFVKALYWLIVDRDFFIRRLKEYLRRD